MSIKLKIDPQKLPEAPFPPTRESRGYVDNILRTTAIKQRREANNQKMWQTSLQDRLAKYRTNSAKESRVYTPEMDAKILKMANEKMPYKQIADEVGVTVPAIKSRIARLRGGRGKYGKTFFYTPEQDALIKKLRAEGKAFAEIGKELGKTESAIRKRAKRIM